jgi:hypothetical protein
MRVPSIQRSILYATPQAPCAAASILKRRSQVSDRRRRDLARRRQSIALKFRLAPSLMPENHRAVTVFVRV